MKQFQKYGVAAAVASVATGVIAQTGTNPEISKNEAGDLAIVPYYTVLDGKNTGLHIINTTDMTQVVKVRLRRGADSKDALDFNLVMSPRDEWTANLGANPNGDGVVVTTNDTTCTVPAFPEGGAVMPSTFAEGAEEGYVEVIAMAQPSSEAFTLAVAAEHDDGVPLSCAVVRQNFFRVSDALAYDLATFPNGDSVTRGTHYSDVTSSAVCTANAADTGGACDIEDFREAFCGANNIYTDDCNNTIIDLLNATFYEDSDDNALKVSWMITDSDGGLEIGDNAVMVSGFSDVAMMTNQELLSFGTNGVLRYDALNFELPNLSWAAWNDTRGSQFNPTAAGNPGQAFGLSAGSMMPGLMNALDAEALINDWAAFDTDAGTVATDWVVTLPGQYTMQNPICDAYDAYAEAATACAITTAGTNVGLSSAGATDEDQLPLYLAGPDAIGLGPRDLGDGITNMLLWDREEMPLIPTIDTPDTDLGFSPGGSAGTEADPIQLNREVNVITFQDGDVLGSAADQTEEDLGLRFTVTVDEDGNPPNRGWAQLVIQEQVDEELWVPHDGNTLEDEIDPNDDGGTNDKDGWGSFDPSGVDTVAVIGFAAWERSFADQAGNYGRAIEHSTISSSTARN